jgi:hypothetical protein
MAFNVEKFAQAEFQARTKVVSVPTLAEFFDKNEKPEWEVRSLTATELNRAMLAKDSAAFATKVVEAINRDDNVTEALKTKLGYSNDVPAEIAKRMEMLVCGSVNPEITLPVAVKLAEVAPIEFLALTNQITELTGMGFQHAKKPKAALQKTTN